MKFISLGSGSSGNCYLLQSGETSILLDAGISIRSLKKHLKDCDVSLEHDVKAVFVTHDHADHIKSVGCIACDYGKTIYATQLVHEGIACNRCLKIDVPNNRKAFIEKGTTLEVGNFRITPFDVPHDSRDCVGRLGEDIERSRQGDADLLGIQCVFSAVDDAAESPYRVLFSHNEFQFTGL